MKTLLKFLKYRVHFLLTIYTIIIIDNLTFMLNQVEKSNLASEFIKKLKQLKTENDLSILILAHTPKLDFAKPLTNNHLQGSKMIINFVDSCFAIGKSYLDSDLKYIKHIKVRNCEHIYDEHNVCICKTHKGLGNNFLQLEFIEFGSEFLHLNRNNDDYIESLQTTIDLKKQGLSNVEIAKRLNISEATVRKRLKNTS